MFQQSLLQTSAAAAGVRRRSTFFAVSAQMLILTAAIIIPRMYIEPLKASIPSLSLPTPIFTHRTPVEHTSERSAQSNAFSQPISQGNSLTYRRGSIISSGHPVDGGGETVPSADFNFGTCTANCTPAMGNVRIPEVHLQPPARPVPVSHLDPGMLINRIEPVYPQPAIIIRQQGVVVLHAVIAKDGRISELHALYGPALLIGAALNAVSQWRYKPYVLNGQAVPVETEIRVNFTLQR